LLLAALAQPALAQPAAVAPVRTGDHPGFGRVVIDLAPDMKPAVSGSEAGVVVRLDGAAGPVAPAAGARAPRNVRALAVRDGSLEITLVPGARLRSFRLGNRLVFDIADPPAEPVAAVDKPAAPPPPAAAAARRPAPDRAAPDRAAPDRAAPDRAAPDRAVPAAAPSAAPARAPAPPVPAQAAPAPPTPARAAPAPAAAPRPAPATPPPIAIADLTRGQSPEARHRAHEDALAAAAGPVPAPQAPLVAPAPLMPVEVVRAAPALGLAATLSEGDPTAPVALTLPFGPTSGAAALRRGELALVVFDERRPVDLSTLRADPQFGAASIALLPNATVLRLPLATDRQLRLARVEKGWTVTVLPADPAPAALLPIRAEAQDGRLRMALNAPGQVVAMADPLSGSTLLVGTQRAEGQGMPMDRRSPEFAVLPTWQGVAVLPLTDALALRPQLDGFVLAPEAERALSLSAPESQTQAMTLAAVASRRFDLPALPLEQLHRRMQGARLAAASAPPQARSARRRTVMETMLALGMGAEMQAVATATVAEDARAAEDPDIVALSAIAALLAGRTEQGAGIADPRLDGTDEIAFWRALREAQLQPGAPRAAAIFAGSMPLLLSYPPALRDRLLPTVLETMAQGGEAAAAAAVLARLPDLPALDLARGMVAERSGDAAAALAAYGRVTDGSDRRARAVAARAAVELRLARGELTAAAAADALEKLVFAWRGDGVEMATRLRVAELRAQAGAWRTALGLLREARGLFPEQEASLGRALGDVFARSLAPDAQEKLSPLDLVALAEENADLLPSGPAGHALAVRLADRLMALDLPERALPVLEKLVEAAPAGIGRASLGATLAGLRMEQGAGDAALAVLSSTVVEGAIPPDLLERRTLIFARAAAAGGDVRAAVGALGELGTPDALLLRAELLERAKDWPAASAALSALARASLPASGPLDAAQSRLVLRLAAAAVQAGDERALAGLRTALAPRLAEAQMRDLAALLSLVPVRGVGDLPRAAEEMRLARGAPDSLRAVGAER
jgi:hypothetical protein